MNSIYTGLEREFSQQRTREAMQWAANEHIADITHPKTSKTKGAFRWALSQLRRVNRHSQEISCDTEIVELTVARQ